MTSIRVTPLNENLIENGIYPSEKFDHATLRKCNWPTLPNQRKPEGGTGGEFFAEDVKVEWKNNKLIFPIGEIEVPIAERNQDRITYYGSFVAQLDSDVAYYPEKHFVSFHSKDFIILVCGKSTTANNEFLFRAIKVPDGYGVVVEACVPHSMPIPLHANNVDFKVYHRSVNSVAQFKLTNALNINTKDLDESTTVKLVKIICEEEERDDDEEKETNEKPKKLRLPMDFTSDLLQAHPANKSNFIEYGKFIENVSEHEEIVSHVPWPINICNLDFPGLEYNPGSTDELSDCIGGSLIQDFKMTWIPHSFEPNCKTIKFNGLSGSFAGAEGKPGVEFNKSTNEYKVDVLMTRPDGSFYIFSNDRKANFYMIFAKPTETTGEPLKESLKVFSFAPGQGAHIEAGYWHSVPIPHASNDSVEFRETVAETNANIVANVHFECTGRLKFTS